MYSNDIGIVYLIHSASKNFYYLKLAFSGFYILDYLMRHCLNILRNHFLYTYLLYSSLYTTVT